jgi:hypothetical protein
MTIMWAQIFLLHINEVISGELAGSWAARVITFSCHPSASRVPGLLLNLTLFHLSFTATNLFLVFPVLMPERESALYD